MSLALLVDIVHSGNLDNWKERNEQAFEALFGGRGGRYSSKAQEAVVLRAPAIKAEGGVPYAAYVHPSNPKSGSYSGLSFVIAPIADHPCLIQLCVGTGGLAPDHGILGRPGHARKAQAICAWLSNAYGRERRVAWAKQDPTRTDISVPSDVTSDLAEYKSVFDRYGKEIYAVYRPTNDKAATAAVLAALLDLMFEERGFQVLAGEEKSSKEIQAKWFEYLMPGVEKKGVVALLDDRKYVIVQGPPGTGKTRMATDILKQDYGGFGQSIQFHPNTTYENFIGGLAPTLGGGDFGLKFSPVPGFLMQAAAKALEMPEKPYLLHIDEINRADLGKILGEAIFLLEAAADGIRKIELPYDFGPPFGSTFYLSPNLHILGTMNSADRSIAIVDVAVRRRFAFVSLWPSMAVVQEHGCSLMQDAFRKLTSHFIEHATDDAFSLVPGHSYFLETDEGRARQSLQVNLAPLLEEYLAQGYVGGFSEPIRSYLQWVQSL